MAAKTLATYIGELSAGSSLGAGDKLPVLESGAMVYFDGASVGAGTITALTGDVTASGSGSVAATIASDAVTNAKLANMATQTIKGRTTAGSGDPEDLTATQATAILNTMVGDSGSGGTKGLVPAPSAGDAAAGKFLKADGTWATAGGGSSYSVYTALLTQTGTDAPTATVLENTLGGTVVWTRNDVGDYTGTLAGVFTENKTWCIAGTGFYNDNATNANVTRASSDTISLLVSSANGAIIDDWSDAAIEIRVYP